MRRVFDCFIFNDELDLLEARLTELDDVVYRFVLAEAPVTHQDAPKPLWYAEHKERFAPWADRIIHVVAGDLGDGEPRAREHTQREALFRGLDGLRDDDIFLLSDVDEIPRPGVVQGAAGHVLPMRNHLLAVNLLDPGWWPGTMACLGRPPGSMKAFRERRNSPEQPVLSSNSMWAVDGGWHFSWLGGPAAMKAKARSFSHPEAVPLFDAHAERLWRDRISPASGVNRLVQVVVDDTYPRYMQDRKGPACWYWPGDG